MSGAICGSTGILIALSLISACVPMQIYAQSVNNTDLPLSIAILVGTVDYIAIAIYEEGAFRGYWLINLIEGFVSSTSRRLSSRARSRLALFASPLISSTAFMAYHALLGGASALSDALIIVYGTILCVFAIMCGDLGLAIGFHFGWNFAESLIFGIRNSGMPPYAALLTVSYGDDARWCTGGAFGVEGGRYLSFRIIYFSQDWQALLALRARRSLRWRFNILSSAGESASIDKSKQKSRMSPSFPPPSASLPWPI